MAIASFSSALTLSCGVSSTCPYPSVPVMYAQNDTGGYDNAHAQNSSPVSLQGLVGWYRLDNVAGVGESASVVFDWSGMGNNGTPSGATYTSAGKLDGAYSFIGASSHINLGSSAAFDMQNFTISLWWDGRNASNWAGPFNNRLAGRNGFQFVNDFSSASHFTPHLVIWNGTAETAQYKSSTTQYALPFNGFKHFVWTYNGTAALYVDGAPVTVANSGVSNYALTGIYIGRAYTSVNGTVDDVMVFNRSLTPAEVSAIYNRQFSTYNYALCCSSPDAALSGGCSQVNVTRMSNYTNAHVQATSYSGTAYSYPACLASSPGKVQCMYSDTSCSAPYACIGSMASSELADANQTNAHIASCNTYKKKICCKLNTPPVVSNAVINSTFGTNYTTENLSVYFSQVDADSDFTTNITDWRVNGASLAVLNMPFNTEESSTAANAIKDYSTFGNNGTLYGSTVWNSSGKVGGAYQFSGAGDSIVVQDSPSIDLDNHASFSLWIKPDTYGTYYAVHPFTKWGGSTTDASFVLYYFGNYTGNNANGNVGVYGTAGGAWKSISSIYNRLPLGTWTHVGWTYDSVTGGILYINGAQYGVSTGSGALALNNYNLYIVHNAGFDGAIDEVLVFNRTLSAAQMKEIYLAGLAGMSVQRIHADETSGGEMWSCSVTANDGMDGNTLLSNNLTIQDSLPTVTLLSPPDGNATTNRTPMFTWDGVDPDGDPLTYEINLTAMFLPGSMSTCSDVLTATTANEYYVPTRDLSCLRDNGMVYHWSVRAHDGSAYGDWSETRMINITALLAISLPVNTMEFGSMRIGESNDTTDDSPAPFVLQNDGNSLSHINVSATPMWQSAPAESHYYQYKAANVTGEEGAFNWTGSVTSFANISSSERKAIDRLNYTNIKDSSKFDVRVQVPPNEPPALRNSTITFRAILGEN